MQTSWKGLYDSTDTRNIFSFMEFLKKELHTKRLGHTVDRSKNKIRPDGSYQAKNIYVRGVQERGEVFYEETTLHDAAQTEAEANTLRNILAQEAYNKHEQQREKIELHNHEIANGRHPGSLSLLIMIFFTDNDWFFY